jgi:hypothetical protein
MDWKDRDIARIESVEKRILHTQTLPAVTPVIRSSSVPATG